MGLIFPWHTMVLVRPTRPNEQSIILQKMGMPLTSQAINTKRKVAIHAINPVELPKSVSLRGPMNAIAMTRWATACHISIQGLFFSK